MPNHEKPQPSGATSRLASLFQGVREGRLSVEAAIEQAAGEIAPLTLDLEDAHVDLDRRRRCGFPEVVYAEGKTADAVVAIFEAQARHGERGLATRVSPEQAAAVLTRFPEALHNPIARTIRLPPPTATPPVGSVYVITAGTSDRPMAEEAIETLRWMGCGAELIVDIGVAGPQRLLQQKHRFEAADAVVVVAGMEGALPSVVGGWVACPVVAVPTSVGYGANFGGIAALLGMLNSCASNVCVVNIDAGFKGGYLAGVIARQLHERGS
ncbi:MAG TPA: nickel pincer cofactor biosynthesis protein LarB [Planctomycetaceae bacterium]|nr:nickel pincer cofactor biosynthesis protein LarB [Planctomycetaceae bacterium]